MTSSGSVAAVAAAAALGRRWAGGAGGAAEEELLPAHLGMWLYGLMVRLELPISANVAAAMRRVVVVAERCRARRLEGCGDGACAGEAGAEEMRSPRAERGVCAGRDCGDEGGGGAAGTTGGDEAMDCEGGDRGAHDESAMYDTLRVVAGGFFGQDGMLAPVVDDYLVRSSLR